MFYLIQFKITVNWFIKLIKNDFELILFWAQNTIDTIRCFEPNLHITIEVTQ